MKNRMSGSPQGMLLLSIFAMPNTPSGPLPPQGPVTIPLFNVTVQPNGTTQIPPTFPFYYAGIQTIWLWYQVDLPLLEQYLQPLGMTPINFGGAGAVNVSFFNAAALYGTGSPGNPGVAGFNETELNIVACAANQAGNVPTMTLKDFLLNGDQTKRAGAYRVWVACDNAVAVACGVQMFLENKFLCPYTYTVPALNLPGVTDFTWAAHDPTNTQETIYSAKVTLDGLNAVPGNQSEWIDLSYSSQYKRVAGSRRNYFGMYDTYFVPPARHGQIGVSIGNSAHPMRKDMEALVGARPAFAVQLFRSAPCIAEAQPYWADL